ncbi:MAG TPA: APC family permease [Candidatus Aminicenantes bacterium]|nr:APC family permease [Candidatus Aminicenantes bacterium]HRY65540.1 APC family permease [Candidatus Aminicenantes bacterium]HRZ72572.1 APC family permease [Candidatus Aminicenantes bacterium]
MNDENGTLGDKIRRTVFGKPRNIKDPSLFHKLALIPVLAWIGLGADGLSSASYGPEEAFRTLGQHTYLAIGLALATALTVFIISYAYSRIIEYFPSGGGGYIVATHTLGEKFGVISGAALLVDYMLTITVSIVSCGDALFSFFPLAWQPYKTVFEVGAILFLVVINLRGIKESVTLLAPIFLTFVATHALLIGYGLVSHIGQVGPVSQKIAADYRSGLAALGGWGMLFLFLRSFSMGGGTFTGIEAVSNGLQILREPRVQNGKRTMVYLAASLAVTAGGILVCYLLLGVTPIAGKTLNAVLAGKVFAGWGFGPLLALVTIFSEGALLLVGAQTGFVDGPRVIGNMAVDYWFPHRFASLSDRLTMQNGVLMMGGAALALLLYSKGHISTLIVMYSINVFLTFSLSELGMSRFFIRNRKTEPHWKKHLPVHLTGLTLCLTILIITTYEKFTHGGWLTLIITAVVIALCYLIKGHYSRVRKGVRELDDMLVTAMPHKGAYNAEPTNSREMTAIQLVSGYSGFGVHTFLSIIRGFPGLYKNFVFVSVAEVDAGAFKESESVAHLTAATKDSLKKYVDLARHLGFPAESRFDTGIDVVATASSLCESAAKEFPKSTVFAGQTVFRRPGIVNRILHNETAFAIQQELRWKGITTVILPIRINI